MNVSSSFLVIYSCNQFFLQNWFHSEMFYQHLSYLKKVYIAINVQYVKDNYERPLN